MPARAAELLASLVGQTPWRLRMNLRRLEPADWLWVTEHHANEIKEKRRLLAAGAEIKARAPDAPETEAAIQETINLIRTFLRTHHPGLSPPADADDPLVSAGLLVQEDLCWLAPGPDGYRLVAAFVAFPAGWRLADKIGRPLPAIHAPVPGLEQAIGRPLARVFDTLDPERPVWRANWSLADDPTLHQPRRSRAAAVEALYLRVERQTLRRLPRTGQVLFTIHTLVEPLAQVARTPATARALLEQIDLMPPAMRAYKDVDALRSAAAADLDVPLGAA